MITYAHKKDPKGPRFRQTLTVALPKWAVDVQCEDCMTYQRINEVLKERIHVLEAALEERRYFMAFMRFV